MISHHLRIYCGNNLREKIVELVFLKIILKHYHMLLCSPLP